MNTLEKRPVGGKIDENTAHHTKRIKDLENQLAERGEKLVNVHNLLGKKTPQWWNWLTKRTQRVKEGSQPDETEVQD